MEKVINNIKRIWASCKNITEISFNKAFRTTNSFAKKIVSVFALLIAGFSFIFLVAGVVLSSVSALMIYEGYETITYLKNEIPNATES